MTTNPYKVGEKFSGGVNKVADVFGAASDVSYPGGAIHQAHANYRVNKYVNKHVSTPVISELRPEVLVYCDQR